MPRFPVEELLAALQRLEHEALEGLEPVEREPGHRRLPRELPGQDLEVARHRAAEQHQAVERAPDRLGQADVRHGAGRQRDVEVPVEVVDELGLAPDAGVADARREVPALVEVPQQVDNVRLADAL